MFLNDKKKEAKTNDSDFKMMKFGTGNFVELPLQFT